MLAAFASSVFMNIVGAPAVVASEVAVPSRPAVAMFPVERALPVAVIVWMIGVVLLSGRIAWACLGIARLKRATREIDETVSARARAFTLRLGITRSVSILESTVVRVPTMLGYMRPIILLPAAVITGLPAPHLDAVIVHELAHVRRHDYLVNALQAIIETLLFYHPAVWWCSRQIRIEREHCCDDVVVDVLGDRVAYAAALVELEELRGLQPILSLNATGGRLIDRVRRVLELLPVREGYSMTWMIFPVLAVATTVVAGATTVVAGATAVALTPTATIADAADARVTLQADAGQWDLPPLPPLPPVPPLPPRTPSSQTPKLPSEVPEVPAPPIPPAPPLAPAPPVAPVPPAIPAVPAPPAVLELPALPDLPALPAPPAIPAAPALPALSAPPSPPVPPTVLGFAQGDVEFVAEELRRASRQLVESLDELRRAREELLSQHEALRQTQAELQKMREALRQEFEKIQKR
jgi:beta-lactamase regulating signal transducer with metallopeptidase domain